MKPVTRMGWILVALSLMVPALRLLDIGPPVLRESLLCLLLAGVVWDIDVPRIAVRVSSPETRATLALAAGLTAAAGFWGSNYTVFLQGSILVAALLLSSCLVVSNHGSSQAEEQDSSKLSEWRETVVITRVSHGHRSVLFWGLIEMRTRSLFQVGLCVLLLGPFLLGFVLGAQVFRFQEAEAILPFAAPVALTAYFYVDWRRRSGKEPNDQPRHARQETEAPSWSEHLPDALSTLTGGILRGLQERDAIPIAMVGVASFFLGLALASLSLLLFYHVVFNPELGYAWGTKAALLLSGLLGFAPASVILLTTSVGIIRAPFSEREAFVPAPLYSLLVPIIGILWLSCADACAVQAPVAGGPYEAAIDALPARIFQIGGLGAILVGLSAWGWHREQHQGEQEYQALRVAIGLAALWGIFGVLARGARGLLLPASWLSMLWALRIFRGIFEDLRREGPFEVRTSVLVSTCGFGAAMLLYGWLTADTTIMVLAPFLPGLLAVIRAPAELREKIGWWFLGIRSIPPSDGEAQDFR